MTSLILWLLVAVAAGLAAWRVAIARRRAAVAREDAVQAAAAAVRAVTPPAGEPALAAESARAKAERVIAAETARRKAALKKAENAARAESDRRAAQTAAAADKLASTLPLDTPVVSASPARRAREDAIARAMDATTPVLPPAPPAPRPPAAPTVLKTAAQTLVMLVDDSKMVRVKSSRLLAAHEFQVVTAVDGKDALQQLEHCCPDLVITDVDMPEMDGFGLTAALRANPRMRHIPIVMITSAEDRHREEALRAGVGLVMGKPYDEAALIAHIRSFRFFAKAEDIESLACA